MGLWEVIFFNCQHCSTVLLILWYKSTSILSWILFSDLLRYSLFCCRKWVVVGEKMTASSLHLQSVFSVCGKISIKLLSFECLVDLYQNTWLFTRFFILTESVLSRNYRLIVAPRKLDVLKTNISLWNSFKNIKFPRGNYQTDSSKTKTLCCLYCPPLRIILCMPACFQRNSWTGTIQLSIFLRHVLFKQRVSLSRNCWLINAPR